MALPSATNDKVWKALEEQRQALYTMGREATDRSYEAEQSGKIEDYKDAAVKLTAAFNRAKAIGMGDMAKSYATRAAFITAAVDDPESAAYKAREAKATCAQAWIDDTAETHEAAAKACEAVADAYEADNQADYQISMWRNDAKAHIWAAEKAKG